MRLEEKRWEQQESLNLTRLPLVPGGSGPAGPEESLNPGDVRDRYPSFSSDGSQIAFGDNRLVDQEVSILDLATRHRERLRLPRSGSKLAFLAPRLPATRRYTRFQSDGSSSYWIAAGNEDKKSLDIWSSVVVSYNSIGRGFVEAD